MDLYGFKKHGKPSIDWSISGKNFKTCRRTLKRIVGKKHRTTAAKATTDLDQHLNRSVSIKAVRRELNEAGYHGIANVRKHLASTINIQKRLNWCRYHKGWYSDQWKQVIFSDESSFSLFPTAGRVYVWRQPWEAYNPELLPTMKHRGGSVKFGKPHRGNLSFPSLPCMVRSTAMITWTSWEIMYIQWSRHYFLIETTSSKTIMFDIYRSCC